MNTKIRWLMALTVVLAIANIGLVAFIWLRKDEPKKAGRAADARGYLIESLSMNEVQVMGFDSLRKEHFEAINKHKAKVLFLKDRLFMLLRDTVKQDIKNQLITYLRQKLGETESAIDIETYEHFARLQSLLSKQQQRKLHTTVSEILRDTVTGFEDFKMPLFDSIENFQLQTDSIQLRQ